MLSIAQRYMPWYFCGILERESKYTLYIINMVYCFNKCIFSNFSYGELWWKQWNSINTRYHVILSPISISRTDGMNRFFKFKSQFYRPIFPMKPTMTMIITSSSHFVGWGDHTWWQLRSSVRLRRWTKYIVLWFLVK